MYFQLKKRNKINNKIGETKMGKALEVIAGGATAPGATFTALTMGAGNSLTIRNFKTGTTAYIVGLLGFTKCSRKSQNKKPSTAR